MTLFERLYDESEKVNVQFVGMTTDHSRYDFGIVYTSLFFGKPLINCLQSGKCLLLGREDVEDLDMIKSSFQVTDDTEALALSEFLKSVLPPLGMEAQY
ncbi:DUF3055 domain-containing protein [Salipaludibacillus agaradhaerens]|jgi:hypothetical protein|uniref:DUF3055 domain-containing protein n=1 Tax=Salipaludibacillus agaradhaerens TaxID=76935 RepID=A0A9Q4B0Q4_SALAG|nr:DUF3055 domain-containing protein [Salipaludibacillus agaradhaerens]UJW58290.1 DUF3055 domain-containing protein [Bacillus sp. A116_S68]MCR6095892.1 DUF3055 domain-containing protein [Salipaludibacillus agaradhaerens]MCR6107221.1 DUF3055 domain-containing protein [Salipaludibacillus agaradhaerens]MCR6114549.1 DUF3055 domain-containing protein [Salipaludibacillus agaradhaerens]MCR6119250.1 DUF3055 domain-containing protein [Salipaludibacillus agaradhaerens]